jgi:hypothetical protein
MNITDFIFQSLETILKVFDADPGSFDHLSRMEKFGSGIRDKHIIIGGQRYFLGGVLCAGPLPFVHYR